jgi:Mg2+/Co2+ transporter CorB
MLDFFDYISIPIVLILVFLWATFSATETAFLSASRARLHVLSKQGSQRAKTVIHLRDNMETIISSILLCTNLVNNMVTAFATAFLTSLVGDAGVAYASILVTFLGVIYCEIMPKLYAIRHANGIALTIAPLIQWTGRVLRPMVFIIEYVAHSTLKLFGIQGDGKSFGNTLEELRGAIDLHHSLKDPQVERAMLHSILDLNDVSVDDIMIHRKDVEMLDGSLCANTLFETLVNSPHSRLPVYLGVTDNIVGILHSKVFLKAVKNNVDNLDHIDVLSLIKKPWFVPEKTNLYAQLQAFRARQEHLALVVDEYGVFQGIVTLEDIIEEIVGEIADEHDPHLQEVSMSKSGHILASGATTVRELNRKFNWLLPDVPSSTLGGLVMHESRVIPKVGQSFKIHGFQMTILKKAHHQITVVRITPPVEEGE